MALSSETLTTWMRAMEPTHKRILTRRLSLLMYGVAFGEHVLARPKLGDAEWIRRFRDFIKAFNDFVVALDDDKLDRAKWEQMRTKWQRLEVD